MNFRNLAENAAGREKELPARATGDQAVETEGPARQATAAGETQRVINNLFTK